ncbi:DUF6446 family protein [Jannaschia rubra]|uniref:Histidine kinase n=1 Tax=Jannaschia rubra TaxID=282197 RepID=A0A0M6XN42_9RHOB|nr:DUF6446 family protein [Jannaschia rubra]CTQ32348.1 hypothetical protein JAN5088_01113 [Jannaschia rubra]SFG46567.1 hypothetical protein SAMN04488517_10591 [Jannaschia rubra]
MGKFAVIAILLSALLVGGGIWYAQTRGYYATVDGPVTLTLAAPDGSLTTLPVVSLEAIASSSSPLGFRACFVTDIDQTALGGEIPVEVRAAPAPTIAPPWFDCFDAGVVDGLLQAGEATAYTAYHNAQYGVDRIVALTPDGRGWAWHELNDCGDKAYDGTPVGEECPDRASFEPLIEGSL